MPLAPPLSDFVEKIALFMEDEGLPRIAGRIIGLFTIEGGPLSFSDVVERLGVSRASVSTNLRLVRDRGIVELVGRPGDRQDYYRLSGDPYRMSLERALKRLESTEALALDTAGAIEASHPAAHERLLHMARVNATARVHVKQLWDALYG